MAKVLGAQNHPPIDSNKPVPSPPRKMAEVVRQAVPPPRHTPTSSSGGRGRAPTPVEDSSGNGLYMSRLEKFVPEGRDVDVAIMSASFLAMKFPPELAQAPFSVKQIKREGWYPSAIIVGPSDNPQWADQMMAAKAQSDIKFSKAHMSKARPRAVQPSPDRRRKEEELEARFRRISLGGSPSKSPSQSPMQQSPMQQKTPDQSFDSPPSVTVSSGGRERRNKRELEKTEGREMLTYDESGEEAMQLSSPTPVQKSKQANVRQTPAPVRVMKMQAGLGSGPRTQGGGGTPPEGDDDEVDVAGTSSGEKEDEEEEDPFALGDDAPPAPEERKVRGDESKGDEDAMPN